MINELTEIKQYTYRHFKTQEAKDKFIARIKNWQTDNRELVNEQARASYHRNKHKHTKYRKLWHIHNNYGITEEQYEELFLSQDNKCLICKRDVREVKYLCIDHNHETGKVRGLLCKRCNSCLGWYEQYDKNINEYLEKTQ